MDEKICLSSAALSRIKQLIPARPFSMRLKGLVTPPVVSSKNSRHLVVIHVNGLPPGEIHVILNHCSNLFRNVGYLTQTMVQKTIHLVRGIFQFLGKPVTANRFGRLNVNVLYQSQ